MDKTTFQIRSVDTEARTIEGIAAPYNELIDAGDYYEKFAPGAFGDIKNVRLYSEHDHLDKRAPIGMVLDGRDTEDGFVIRARISATDKGNEVYELVRDGVLSNFSVGFVPLEDRIEDDNTVVRTKVELREVSVVAFPAYKSAQILAVRSEDASAALKDSSVREDSETTNTTIERGHTNMSDNINFATVADLNDVRDEMDRRIAVLGDAKPAAAPVFRSAGDWLKALHRGDDNAAMEVRAYTGATSADSHVGNDWKNDVLRIVEQNRTVLNLFNRGPLGPSGNTVEYPYVSATSGAVSSQVNEGDDLPYLEVAIATASAPVLTYGGYSELTRQAIERSDVSYLDAVLRFQAQQYAKATNDKVRSTLAGASVTAGTSFTLASATAADVLGAVVDGVAKISALGVGAQADFVLVSSDVYAKLVTVGATGMAFDSNASAGATIGTANIRGLAGSLAGVPIVVDGSLAAKSFYVASNTAITTWESAGAPVRLDDENIINLTRTFSLYGYMAVGVTNASAIVKATVS